MPSHLLPRIDNGHVRNIERASTTPNDMVLLKLGTVVQWHVPAPKIHDLRVCSNVHIVERRFLSHTFRSDRIHQQKKATERT